MSWLFGLCHKYLRTICVSLAAQVGLGVFHAGVSAAL